MTALNSSGCVFLGRSRNAVRHLAGAWFSCRVNRACLQSEENDQGNRSVQQEAAKQTGGTRLSTRWCMQTSSTSGPRRSQRQKQSCGAATQLPFTLSKLLLGSLATKVPQTAAPGRTKQNVPTVDRAAFNFLISSWSFVTSSLAYFSSFRRPLHPGQELSSR